MPARTSWEATRITNQVNSTQIPTN